MRINDETSAKHPDKETSHRGAQHKKCPLRHVGTTEVLLPQFASLPLLIHTRIYMRLTGLAEYKSDPPPCRSALASIPWQHPCRTSTQRQLYSKQHIRRDHLAFQLPIRKNRRGENVVNIEMKRQAVRATARPSSKNAKHQKGSDWLENNRSIE